MRSAAVISVVTVVRDRADLVEECIASVRAQRGCAHEHVVIDGASTDGTVEILERHGDAFAYWHSRPDSGIADAMNQGLAHASGDWVLFLHADDVLSSPDALARVAEVLSATPCDIVGFPLWFERGGARVLKRPRGANAWLKLKTGFLHQATFFRRALFERIGAYDTRYRIAMDYEFFLRAWLAQVAMGTDLSLTPSTMRDTGISSRTDWGSVAARLAEERAIHARYATTIPQRVFYAAYWPTYLAYRRIRAGLRPAA